MTTTTTDRELKEPIFRLRVLTEYDDAYKFYVARCLETGHVVTADSPADATNMMKELLGDEIAFSVEHQNFPNLFSSPASADVWVRWMNLAAKLAKPPEKFLLPVNARELRLDEREVSTEIKVANASAT